MNKRERVEATFHNQEVDHVPVCLWWHFDGSWDQDRIVRAHLDFFHDTDEDMMKISSDGFFGWPAKALEKPYDVKKLYEIEHIPLDHPYMRGQIERCKAITQALHGEAVAIYTTFNPLSLIRLQVGWDQMMKWMHQDPKAILHACEVIGEDHTALMDALLEEGGVDGFMYSVQNAEVNRFTIAQYRSWVTPAEWKELSHLHEKTEYVALHCCGWDADVAHTHNHLESWQNYPANMIGWSAYVDHRSITEIREFFHGLPAWGGLDNRKGCLLQTGTKEEVQAEVRRLIAEGGKKGYMIGPDCSLPNIGTERIQWVVEAARSV